jgi:hypothetical protein
MNLITRTSLLGALASATTLAVALPDYRCSIERVHGVAPDTDPVIIQERKLKIGREFNVERTTGMMVGVLKNSFATRPQVIDKGSKDNAFKAVTTMRLDQGAGSGSAVYTLVINEYRESAKKPFVFLSGDIVYFSNCTHFQ